VNTSNGWISNWKLLLLLLLLMWSNRLLIHSFLPLLFSYLQFPCCKTLGLYQLPYEGKMYKLKMFSVIHIERLSIGYGSHGPTTMKKAHITRIPHFYHMRFKLHFTNQNITLWHIVQEKHCHGVYSLCTDCIVYDHHTWKIETLDSPVAVTNHSGTMAESDIITVALPTPIMILS